MVFAIAMKTVLLFERALGRMIFWSYRQTNEGGSFRREPIYRLRIYPHALREANAYYSRDKKALLFGYFRSRPRDSGAQWVFTALSHDVIAHETTHAILDGLHRRYAEPTSVDSMAFHEAFADIVAMLSHFMLPEAVRHEIATRGGSLNERSLLSGLAMQFGRATGMKGSLREGFDDKPDERSLDALTEPHDRGEVLLAAIFDAFATIYHRRVADLLRIANVRLEKNVKQELHPDLVNRLTREACKTADHLLRMCIRALDYLPPVDVRFGEFLRAIVTADYDLVPLDPYGYRLAVVEAFRRRGIYPADCLSLAVDSLLWDSPRHELDMDDLKDLDAEPKFKRDQAYDQAERNRLKAWKWFRSSDANDAEWQETCGIILKSSLYKGDIPQTIARWPDFQDGQAREDPAVEVHSLRLTRRTGPDGQDVRQLVMEVAQRRRGFLNDEIQAAQDTNQDPAKVRPADFIFRGGATLIFDLKSRKLRYVIRKRIDNKDRLSQQRDFLNAADRFGAMAAMYSGSPLPDEPFAMMHREG
jgi:hypothetical protein